ncbi:MAG: carboxypeptidase-like regulatory domain-containing protein [Gemmatimonadaceae bacterium]
MPTSKAPVVVSRVATIGFLLLASGIGCSSEATDPGSVGPSIRFSSRSVLLSAGRSDSVEVTVSRSASPASLSAENLPPGLTAVFSPVELPPGATKSILTLQSSKLVDAAIKIRASRGAESGSGSANVGTAELYVRQAGSLRGIVLEKTADGSYPVSGAKVTAWVQTATASYLTESEPSSSEGEYTILALPRSTVFLMLASTARDQPCASFAKLDVPLTIANVEVADPSRPLYDPSPVAPSLHGTVYERVGAELKSIAGAKVYFSVGSLINDEPLASTTSDESGRYSLCRLPAGSMTISAFRDGYYFRESAVSVAGMMELNIELTRRQ